MEQDEVHFLKGVTVVTPKRKRKNDNNSVKKRLEKTKNKELKKGTNNEEGD